MNNISKIYLTIGIVMMLSVANSVQSPTFFDGTVSAVPEISNVYVTNGEILAGETLNIEISGFTGDVRMNINPEVSVREDEFSYNVTQDTIITLLFNRSTDMFIYVVANTPSEGNFKVYVTGLRVPAMIEMVISSFMVLSALVFEFYWRRKEVADLIRDEVMSLNMKGFFVGFLPIIVFLFDSKIRESRYIWVDTKQIYSWQRHLFSVIINVVGSGIFPLIVILLILSYRFMVDDRKTRQYSIYPIDPLRQYLARVGVYLSVLLPISLYTFALPTLNRGADFSGIEYILSIYIPAYIFQYVTMSTFVLMQILIVDMVRVRHVRIAILPITLILVTILGLGFPPFDLLLLPEIDDTDPFRLYRPIYLLAVLLVVIGLDIYKRRSNWFLAD